MAAAESVDRIPLLAEDSSHSAESEPGQDKIHHPEPASAEEQRCSAAEAGSLVDNKPSFLPS